MSALSDMKLPTGLTCGYCAHYQRCKALFGCKTINMWRQWALVIARQRATRDLKRPQLVAIEEVTLTSTRKTRNFGPTTRLEMSK